MIKRYTHPNLDWTYETAVIGRSGKAVHLTSDYGTPGVSRYPVCGAGSGGYAGLINRARVVDAAVTCRKCQKYIRDHGLEEVTNE